MIVRGNAGTGKTHLLCDAAQYRLGEGRPTVVLMGQSFTSDGAPWPQAAVLLDASDSSTAEFVAALECAAQAAGVRALLMIDALNEGKGLKVWQTHLSGFLAHFIRSDWIGVVLSIRSSYEELIPNEIREEAVVVTHHGFGERSYDAFRTYFTHYGLELPSTPPMAPEFSNPLFLKTLCSGLQGQGATRLPRQINGITEIFDLYISSINKRIASKLGLPPWNRAAEQAVRALAGAFPSLSERWIAVETAEELVNGFLPGRPYEESLYRMLVVEGVFIQEASRRTSHEAIPEIVFIAYDRLADHLVTETLLEANLERENAASIFESRGRLGAVAEGGYDIRGILEALCVLLPERTGNEVADCVPRLAKAEGFESAFAQSLVWRGVGTISARTCELVTATLEPEAWDRYTTILDELLTLATVPDHPLNARFLDARLRRDEMASRDAWWSVHLQYATSDGAAVKRLQDWALTLSPKTELADDLVELCATSLAWMLAASNRIVRDRATKALVNLLTGRFEATARLVERFADVDDPYVVERVYAVAYGVATRTHDPNKVKILADCVYTLVFLTGAPPTNILLRDYARGVVERALYLESGVDVDEALIRPPYRSSPPVFPSDADVVPLLPHAEHDPSRHEGEDWARSHIGQSVKEGELHRAIWENWGCSGEWLSLGLDQPMWQEPRSSGSRRPGRSTQAEFDRRQIERYVLKRVFELGWTTERFGKFDRTWDFDGIGGVSTKESIGRKYQWIAYHEVLALIADHYQYSDFVSETVSNRYYIGPWQNKLRDIDPTLTATLPRGRPWIYRIDSSDLWWATVYDGWKGAEQIEHWFHCHDDLKKIENVLIVRDLENGTKWLNCCLDLRWRQKRPLGREDRETNCEVFCWIRSSMTHARDARTFVDWFNAELCPPFAIGATIEMEGAFIGEHAWAPAASYMQSIPEKRRGEVPVQIEAVAAKYPFRADPRDQSTAHDAELQLPVQKIVQLGGLRWSGHAADFVDSRGNVAAFDPSAYSMGPSALLVREGLWREMMHKNDLGIVWTVECRKTVGLSLAPWGERSVRISGAYMLSETGAVGFHTGGAIGGLIWGEDQ